MIVLALAVVYDRTQPITAQPVQNDDDDDDDVQNATITLLLR